MSVMVTNLKTDIKDKRQLFKKILLHEIIMIIEIGMDFILPGH